MSTTNPHINELVQHLTEDTLGSNSDTEPHERYADVLFELTHERYEPERAKRLWMQILDHERWLRHKLERPVGVRVAALDYLLNVRELLDEPTLISQEQLEQVATMAITDGLTGLVSHAPFLDRLEGEAERRSRYGGRFSLMMLDLDDFKLLNDEHGHQRGDDALRAVAACIESLTRDADVAARYGGEEFAVLAPETRAADAMKLAERIRQRIESGLSELGATVSIGVATCPDHAGDARGVLRCADEALYQSKTRGKNVVTLFR